MLIAKSLQVVFLKQSPCMYLDFTGNRIPVVGKLHVTISHFWCQNQDPLPRYTVLSSTYSPFVIYNIFPSLRCIHLVNISNCYPRSTVLSSRTFRYTSSILLRISQNWYCSFQILVRTFTTSYNFPMEQTVDKLNLQYFNTTKVTFLRDTNVVIFALQTGG